MASEIKAPRHMCSAWASQKFSDAVNSTFWKDEDIRKELKNQLSKLNLLDHNINGYSVQGLQTTQEGFGKGPSYTETFFEVLEETGNCHPIDYLYLLLKKSISMNLETSKITGILARSMRTFASLLRDRDFAILMEEEIRHGKIFKKFDVLTDSIQDSKYHTDVLVTIGEKKFRIWLFQYTSRGLPHDIERITGERGDLPEGIHILCPLKSEKAIKYEYVRIKMEKRKIRLDLIEKRLGEAKEGTKRIKTLEDYKKGLLEELDELNELEKKFYSEIKDEVFICEGWYFYSKDKVTKVLQMIKNINEDKITPESYESVCKILNAPKNYLSEISSFKI
jgi:hypothetical protein